LRQLSTCPEQVTRIVETNHDTSQLPKAVSLTATWPARAAKGKQADRFLVDTD